MTARDYVLRLLARGVYALADGRPLAPVIEDLTAGLDALRRRAQAGRPRDEDAD